MNYILITENACELKSFTNVDDYLKSILEDVSIDNLDHDMDVLPGYRYIAGEFYQTLNGEYVNPVSKIAGTDIIGAVIIIKVDNTYRGYNCYADAIECTEDDVEKIKAMIA